MNRTGAHDFSVSNEELLVRCARQDQEALRVLLRRHERSVYNLLYRMLSNRDDAEEALAEVFVKVWRAAAGFKGDCKFTTWLYKIASNTARDSLRSRQVRQEVSVEEVVIDEARLDGRNESSFGNPEKSAIEADVKSRILRAIMQLSEEDRLLVSLYHLQECDYNEISEIMNVPSSNLKVRLFRARQRLRKLCAYEEEGDSNEMRKDTNQSSGLCQRATESA